MRSFRSLTWGLARACGVTSDPARFANACGVFVAKASRAGGPSLLTTRTEDGLLSFFSARSGPGGNDAAFALAGAVSGRAEQVDGVPDSVADVGCIGWLEFDDRSGMIRESQLGQDVAAVSQALATSLRPGQWVAAPFRAVSSRERKRHSRWLAARNGATAPHSSLGQNATVFSVFAGADRADEVEELLDVVTAVLPGFDLPVRVRYTTRFRSTVGPLLLAALALVVVGGLAGAGAVWREAWASVLWAVAGAAGFGVVVSAAVGYARWAGLMPARWWSLLDAAKAGVLPAPASLPWWRRVRSPQKAGVDRDGNPFEADPGDYPLDYSTFLFGAQVFVPLAAPLAGAASGAESSSARAVPEVLRTPVGPLLGVSDGAEVYLPADVGRWGVFVVGMPGSGKTRLVNALYGWSLADRSGRVGSDLLGEVGLDGGIGSDATLVAFESKDAAGVGEYQAWAASVGAQLRVFELGAEDNSGPAIDMFDMPGTPSQRATAFVNMMMAGFGESAIQDRSFKSLTAVFTAALAVPRGALLPETVPAHEDFPVSLAWTLLGGRGDKRAVDLAAEILRLVRVETARQPGSDLARDLAEAEAALAPLFEGRTESSRRPLVEAAENKVFQLMQLPSWWSPARERISWREVLNSHMAVVVNLGGATDGSIVPEKAKGQLGSMLLHGLQQAIERHCGGWAEQGKSVSVFSDELMLVAGHSSEVVNWLRDQGRSFGVRPVFATQRPGQLPAATRTVVLTFDTVISFQQTDQDTAGEVAKQLSAREGDVKAEDVLHLEPFHALVRTTANRYRLPTFTVRVADFVARRLEAGQSSPTQTAAPVSMVEPDPWTGESMVEPVWDESPIFAEPTVEQTGPPEPDSEPWW